MNIYMVDNRKYRKGRKSVMTKKYCEKQYDERFGEIWSGTKYCDQKKVFQAV